MRAPRKKGRIAFAVCGSFCTLEAALAAAQQLTEQGWELLPIMSFAAKQDTLWHRAVLAGTAGSPYRPCSVGHVAGRGAAWP